MRAFSVPLLEEPGHGGGAPGRGAVAVGGGQRGEDHQPGAVAREQLAVAVAPEADVPLPEHGLVGVVEDLEVAAGAGSGLAGHVGGVAVGHRPGHLVALGRLGHRGAERQSRQENAEHAHLASCLAFSMTSSMPPTM